MHRFLHLESMSARSILKVTHLKNPQTLSLRSKELILPALRSQNKKNKSFIIPWRARLEIRYSLWSHFYYKKSVDILVRISEKGRGCLETKPRREIVLQLRATGNSFHSMPLWQQHCIHGLLLALPLGACRKSWTYLLRLRNLSGVAHSPKAQHLFSGECWGRWR